MSKRKIQILLLLLLLFGSVFLCGCDYDGPMPISCYYDPGSDRWYCFYSIIFPYYDPQTNEHLIAMNHVRYTTKYCNPYTDPNKKFTIICHGKEYAPPSPSPSPSPTPDDSGHYYKITELNRDNIGGGGGGDPGGTS